jgi:rhomboid protease GluP
VNEASSLPSDPAAAETAPEPTPAVQRRIVLPLSPARWSYVFLTLNIVIWLAMMVLSALRGEGVLAGSLSVSTDVLIAFGAKVNLLIAAGQFWRLVTANFLHVSLLHLAFNSYALWQLGPEVERLYGPRRFLVIYLLTGVFGATASYAWGGALSAGASGAIFGLVGVLLAYFLRHRALFGQRGRAYLSNMLFIVVINLFIGFSSPGIDNWGHIGGLISGFLLGYGLVPHYALRGDPQSGAAELVDVASRARVVGVTLLALFVLLGAATTVTSWRRNSAEGQLERARQAIVARDWEAAEEALGRAQQLAPQRAEVYFYWGVVRAQQGQVAAAAEQWEKAAALDAGEPTTLWNLAVAYQALEQPERALAALRRYLELAPAGDRAAQARQMIEQLQAR